MAKMSKPLTTKYLDSNSMSFVQIDGAHQEIHKGTHYIANHYVASLATGGVLLLYIVAPTSAAGAHSKIFAQSTGLCEFSFYKNPTVSAQGTAVTRINRNLNFEVNGELLVYHTPTVTSNGTLIQLTYLGSDRAIGGGLRSEEEFLLKSGDTYLIKIESKANGVSASAGIDWYERVHADL
jgi:hypothetical protein